MRGYLLHGGSALVRAGAGWVGGSSVAVLHPKNAENWEVWAERGHTLDNLAEYTGGRRHGALVVLGIHLIGGRRCFGQ